MRCFLTGEKLLRFSDTGIFLFCPPQRAFFVGIPVIRSFVKVEFFYLCIVLWTFVSGY